MQSDLLYAFQNGPAPVRGRSFPGLRAPHPAAHLTIDPRRAQMIALQTGDVISILGSDPDHPLEICAFDAHGNSALGGLGVQASGSLSQTDCDVSELLAWIARNGGDPSAEIATAVILSDEDQCVLKAGTPMTLWAALPVPRAKLVEGAGPGAVSLSVKKAAQNHALLPPPLAEVQEEFTINRASAQAYELRKGDVVQIIDVDGQQCSDFMAFRSRGLEAGREQMIDSTVTRSMVGGAYPGPGLFDKFFDSEMRPLLNVVQDTVGRHDTFALACTARGYEERGFPGHVNCSDNISDVAAPYGVARRSAWPAINFFFNSWINPTDNRIQSEEAQSRPGDYVAMQAMDDLVCVSTACPDDIDPINGWNPTDIHVRIYRPDQPIRRAIAYREKEDASVSISEHSAFHPRTSALTQNFQPARDLWMPESYPSVGSTGEYWACRTAATLQDMSSLRKYDIAGPDAEALLQLVMTRDVAKLAQWRGTYALICDAQGSVVDDGTLFHIGPHLYRWCCGTEESGRVLAAIAAEHGFHVRIKDMRSSMPNLALQGPKSRDILRGLVFTQPHVPGLDDLKWFGVTMARLKDREGVPFMLARSGYTGELGYELFCDKSGAVALWDAVMEAGASHGLKPMGGTALETIRIEAGLAAAGAEFAPDVDAFEAGLGFAVDLRKTDFIGKAALERNAKDPRRVLKGMILDGDDVPSHGAHVYCGERPVGVVTSATRSPTHETAIAIVRLAVEHSSTETRLEIGQMDGHMKRLSGRVCDIPFVDPTRSRARA